LSTYVPRLLGAGLARGRADLVALGLDLAVPPLALLVLSQLAVLGATALLAAVGLVSSAPLALAAIALALGAAAVAISWARSGRQTLPWRRVLLVRLYLLWKIPLYVDLALRGKQKRWERTARDPERGITPPPGSP